MGALGRKRWEQFCRSFASFWQMKRAQGVEFPRVGRMAAQAAGYGAHSWCEEMAGRAAENAAARLLKTPEIVYRLHELGLVRDEHTGQWRQAPAGEAGTVESGDIPT